MNIARTSALALAAVLVLAPTAAEAKSYVRSDPSGDVVEANTSSNATTKVPARTDGDIVRSAVVHGKGRVTMAVSFRDLVAPTTSDDGVVHIFRVGTNKKRIREFEVVTTGAHPGGVVEVTKGNGNRATCRGVAKSVDYTKNTVRLSVPRRCLGRPKWVHVGIGSIKFTSPNAFADDAATNGYLGNQVKWGPRVFR